MSILATLSSRLPAPEAQPVTARLAAAGSRRRELETVLSAAAPAATRQDYAALILDRNVAGKSSAVSRAKLLKQLRERYLLDPSFAEFLAFRSAVDAEPNSIERGLLCYLMMARCDRLFREAALLVLSLHSSRGAGLPGSSPGGAIDAQRLSDAFHRYLETHALRWSSETEETARLHVLSSLKDFGLLSGSRQRRLLAIRAGPRTASFAARLGEIEGLTASRTLTSRWFALLGADDERAAELLRSAQRAGLLSFRIQAQIVELSLPPVGTR